MKSYEETIETVFKRIEEYEAAQKKRKKFNSTASIPQCDEYCQLDEYRAKEKGKVPLDISDLKEGSGCSKVQILERRKKKRKAYVVKSMLSTGVGLAVCATVLLVAWLPSRLFDTVGSIASGDGSEFRETVRQTDMVSSGVAAESSEYEGRTEPVGEGNINYFTKIFGEEAAEYAFTPAFSDSDGHVRIQGEKMLSDGVNTYLIVSYEYLDELGKRWLNGYFSRLNSADASLFLSIRHEHKETDAFGVGGASECMPAKEAGLQQYETAAKKYFLVSCKCKTNLYSTDCVEVKYPMRGIFKSAVIEMTKYLPRNVYEIEAKLQKDKNYLPVRVSINPVGILLEGKDYGININEISSQNKALEVSSLKLVFRDDSSLDLLDRTYCKSTSIGAFPYDLKLVDDGIDCSIYSGTFRQPVDVGEIKGIWIDDVYYGLGNPSIEE